MFPQPHFIQTNGIRMAVYEQGAGPAVVLLHGFPELAYSWRHQLPALAEAGYRAIAPDLRGYGQTDRPGAVLDYALTELVADVMGLLDACGLESAWFVAHDWGALLAWQIALIEPDRMRGLNALNIPFIRRPPVDPIAYMREEFGPDFYIVDFQDSDAADRVCDANPARVFEVMMRRGQISRPEFETLPRRLRHFSLLAALGRSELRGEALLSPAEARVYVDAFTQGGFTGPINWYRNWTANWEATADVDQTVGVPTLFIGAVDDVLISPRQIEAMRADVPDLEIRMLENCGHWSQQEQPERINALMLDWLARRS